MIIQKNGKKYVVSEATTKWTVKMQDGKVSVAFEVPKDLCKTEAELREFVTNNDKLF